MAEMSSEYHQPKKTMGPTTFETLRKAEIRASCVEIKAQIRILNEVQATMKHRVDELVNKYKYLEAEYQTLENPYVDL